MANSNLELHSGIIFPDCYIRISVLLYAKSVLPSLSGLHWVKLVPMCMSVVCEEACESILGGSKDNYVLGDLPPQIIAIQH